MTRMRAYRTVFCLLSLIFTPAIHADAKTDNCSEIFAWTGCHLDDGAEGCDEKVIRLDFVNVAGVSYTQWLPTDDVKKDAGLSNHIKDTMRDPERASYYYNNTCADGACLSGQEICQ